MTYIGHVKNGLIELDDAVILPEGSAVTVEPLSEGARQKLNDSTCSDATPDSDAPSTVWDRLREFSGTVEGLPPDMAQNHDFYLRQQALDRHDGTPDSSDHELTELLLRHAGKGEDLPHDLAANHDHYAHGKPKP
jgi:hypothetical protein